MSDNRRQQIPRRCSRRPKPPSPHKCRQPVPGLFCNDVLWTFDGNAASRHLPQSSSASRFTAGASGFLNLSQSGVRPER